MLPRSLPAGIGRTLARRLRSWLCAPVGTAGRSPWPEALDWGCGISVVIAAVDGDRGLGASLAAAAAALDSFDEPGEVIVVAGGMADAAHADLERAYPQVSWRFHRTPRGHARALLDGVSSARHGAVYLLDAGLLPDPDALVRAARWRGPGVAVVASVLDAAMAEAARAGIDDVDGATDAVDVPPAAALVHAARLRGWLAGGLADDVESEVAIDLAACGRRAGYDVVACAASRVRAMTADCGGPRRTPVDPASPSLAMRRVPLFDGVLWVTPQRVERAGDLGSARTRCLVQELARDRDVVLLARAVPVVPASDAPWVAAYGSDPVGPDAHCTAVADVDADDALRRTFQRLVAIHRPAVVVVEHLAAATLVDCALPYRPRFVLTLPALPPMPAHGTAARRMLRDLAAVARYDGVVVTSAEDRDLLADPRALVIGQGCDPAMRRDYAPSQGTDIVCFAPAGAESDHDGLAGFVHAAWPSLRAASPGLRLFWVAGELMYTVRDVGAGAPAITPGPAPSDLATLVAGAALVIQPEPARRGASAAIPLALANGRVCVSTWAAARGHRQHVLRALRCCPRATDVAAAAGVLLSDPALRHVLERPDPSACAQFDWMGLAEPLRALVGTLVAEGLAARNASAPGTATTRAVAREVAMAPALGRRLQVT